MRKRHEVVELFSLRCQRLTTLLGVYYAFGYSVIAGMSFHAIHQTSFDFCTVIMIVRTVAVFNNCRKILIATTLLGIPPAAMSWVRISQKHSWNQIPNPVKVGHFNNGRKNSTSKVWILCRLRVLHAAVSKACSDYPLRMIHFTLTTRLDCKMLDIMLLLGQVN